jgi:hypothetical protein
MAAVSTASVACPPSTAPLFALTVAMNRVVWTAAILSRSSRAASSTSAASSFVSSVKTGGASTSKWR